MGFRSLAAAACLAVVCTAANASPPLTLTYSITDLNDGTYRYTFNLTLDNHSGTWTKGDGFGWIIFADRRNGKSALEDWIPDPGALSGGPWYAFTNTSGYNNGPTLGSGRTPWIPTATGQTVSWSGITSSLLPQGELRWSCLLPTYVSSAGKPRGPIANFEIALQRCLSDFDTDGFVTGDDFDKFLIEFANGTPRADIDHDGFVTGDDFDRFVIAFEAGC